MQLTEWSEDDFTRKYDLLYILCLQTVDGVKVFHAGTCDRDGTIVTSGGRVISITGVGNTTMEARNMAYRAVGSISFDGMYYRKDIAEPLTS